MSNWPSRSGEEMNGDSRRWADIMSGCREAPEFILFSLSYSVNRTSGIPKQILSRHYSLSRPSVYIFFSVTLNGVRFSVSVGHSWEQSEYLFLTHSSDRMKYIQRVMRAKYRVGLKYQFFRLLCHSYFFFVKCLRIAPFSFHTSFLQLNYEQIRK